MALGSKPIMGTETRKTPLGSIEILIGVGENFERLLSIVSADNLRRTVYAETTRVPETCAGAANM